MMPLYRSDCHSVLDANPTKYRSGMHSPLEASPNKYCSTMHSPLEAFWVPPEWDSLWTWFKFNEGAGLTVIDYSPFFENGILDNGAGDPTSKFWSIAGFGHNDGTAPLTNFLRTAAVPRAGNFMSFIGF